MTRATYLTAADLRVSAKVPNFGQHSLAAYVIAADPRARYLRLLHQPAKRRFVEGALARARVLAVRGAQ